MTLVTGTVLGADLVAGEWVKERPADTAACERFTVSVVVDAPVAFAVAAEAGRGAWVLTAAASGPFAILVEGSLDGETYAPLEAVDAVAGVTGYALVIDRAAWQCELFRLAVSTTRETALTVTGACGAVSERGVA